MKVIKRDGRTTEFQKEKIKIAILKAFENVDKETTVYAKDKARDIANYIEGLNKNLTVEEIQNIVEEKLMASNRKDVAKAYVIYRNDRDRIREQKSKLTKDIAEKLTAANVQNQNANMDEKSFGGRIGAATSEVMKNYALNYCMSEKMRNNHLNNRIYVHDLDHYAVGDHNCLSIPFDKLLATGFNTRQTDVRPAQSVSTAFQLLAVIFQLQSLQQFGGVSATHIDWTMVPYVRKSFFKHFKDGLHYINNDPKWDCAKFDETLSIEADIYKVAGEAYEYALEMTERETYQAVEGMYHNLKIWALQQ